MSLPRLVQLLGLLIVTGVGLWCLVLAPEPDMLLEFGGLAAGALVFLLGRSLQRT